MSNKKRPEVSVDQLNDMQRYLGEETIEDYQTGQMSRRRMLRRLVLICGSGPAAAALLAACGDSSPTTGSAATTQAATTAASATTAPAGTTAAAMTTSASTTTAAMTTPASTTAAMTTQAATTASATTTAATTTQAAATTATSGTTVAGGTTAAGGPGGGPQPTPGQAKGPLTVPENDPAIQTDMVTTASDPGPSQIITAYIARPKGAGPFPGVIVIHENRGLTDHIKDVARRLAKAGYLALAPDLASRAGGTAKLPTDNVTGYFANAKPEDLVADLNTSLTILDSQTGIKKGKYGVVGFCFGGGYTLRFAAANPKITAAVSYYGPVPMPISQMSATQAAILGQYGALDSRVNAGIPDLEKTLKDAGKTYEKKIYDGANHAFNNDTGASYNEAAAVAAWKETLGWFDKYLKA